MATAICPELGEKIKDTLLYRNFMKLGFPLLSFNCIILGNVKNVDNSRIFIFRAYTFAKKRTKDKLF